MRSKLEKQVFSIIEKISTDLNLEKADVLKLVYSELEKIYNDKLYLPALELKKLKNNFSLLNNKEHELNGLSGELSDLINSANSRIKKTEIDISSKRTELLTRQKIVAKLNEELHLIHDEIKQSNDKIKVLEYDVLINNQALLEKTDGNYKIRGLIIFIGTLIAIIISLIFIKFK